MSTSADNQAQASVVLLPASISVEVNGETITADATTSSAGNIWYEAVQEGDLEDGCNLVDALLASVVKFNGVPMATGKRNTAGSDRVIALSEPSVYPKVYGKTHSKAGQPHPQAGQRIPGSGGKPTISFVSFDAPFNTWGEKGYMLRVTLQGSADGVKREIKITVACQGALGGGQTRIVGHSTGRVKFGV